MFKKVFIGLACYMGLSFLLATGMFFYENRNASNTFMASLREDTLYINNAMLPSCIEKIEDLPIHMVLVDVLNEDGSRTAMRGTAWLVDDNTWLTAAHVTEENPKNIRIKTPSGMVQATLDVYNEEKDIAILKTEGYVMTPIELDFTRPTFHQEVWNIGYPGWALEQRVVSNGKVIGDSKHLFYTTAMAMQGMSGGPTLSCQGDVAMANGVISLFSQLELSATTVVTDTGETIQHVEYINSGESFSSELKSIQQDL